MVAKEKDFETDSPSYDRFGNVIDPAVGYARGSILSSPLEESKRRQYAMTIIRKRAELKGKESFYNFTGLHRNFHIDQTDLPLTEEWIGGAFFEDDLARMAKEHLGGGSEYKVGLFNRATAGIISSCLALAKAGSVVLSVVPGTRSHPSIDRGILLANAKKIETYSKQEVKNLLDGRNVSLVIITGVSSDLDVIEEKILMDTIRLSKEKGIPSFLDDAYGARLRPIIYGQPKTLETGVDIGITSCDKAGLDGPRAGLIVGKAALVERIIAKGGELGLEARPPLSLGVYNSLKKFRPQMLQEEFDLGGKIYEQLCNSYGTNKVKNAGLGAAISEDDALEIVNSLHPSEVPFGFVPAEITAGIGMFWLENYGIVSVNALGQPGARVSLRFKPDPKEMDRFGGIPALIDALNNAFDFISEKCGSVSAMKKLILGES